MGSEPEPSGETLDETLQALIDASQRLRGAVEAKRADEVLALIEERERLIESLSSPLLVQSDETCRALFRRLQDEDRVTKKGLETWRHASGQALHRLSSARTALAGYARTTADESPLIDREL